MSIAPCSLHDLVAFLVNALVALIFYLVYWKLARRDLYLLFANIVVCSAGGCLCVFLADNVVAPGAAAVSVPGAAETTLLIARVAYSMATLYLAALFHFVVRYCGRDQLSRHVRWAYVLLLPLLLGVWSPLLFVPRQEPLCTLVSWSCAVPWWPATGPLLLPYVAVWVGGNIWAQVLLWQHYRASRRSGHPAPGLIKLLSWAIILPVAVGAVEMVAATRGYAGPSFFPVGAIAMSVILAVVLVQEGIAERKWVGELERANRALRDEISKRERVEAERSRLDADLRHLRYLYRLRTALGETRSADEVFQATEGVMRAVLSDVAQTGIAVRCDGRQWRFGVTQAPGQRCYARPLAWGGKERGRYELYCPLTLPEDQERAFVDETAGQIAQVLESRELQAQLIQSARLVSLGQMAAGMAHELHQPLTAIATTAGDVHLRLTEGAKIGPDKLKEMMRHVVERVRRMADTVNHLRVFSRDTYGQPGILFQLNDVVDAALKFIRTQLASRNIALELEFAEDLPEVSGHPHQLEQVLVNLLSNARDAIEDKRRVSDVTLAPAERNSERIAVRTGCGSDPGGPCMVVAEVSDSGIGINEANQGRVFDPFFTTKPADRGTGLGLSISDAIVKNQGGRLSFVSQAGKGATFRIELPLAERG